LPAVPAWCLPAHSTHSAHTQRLTFCLWGGDLPSAKPHTSVLHAKLERLPTNSVSCRGPAIKGTPAGVSTRHVGECKRPLMLLATRARQAAAGSQPTRTTLPGSTE
jgi:hypothetical protein